MYGRTRERVMNGSLGPAVLAKPTIMRPREHMTLARRAGIEKRRVYEQVLVDDAYTRKQVKYLPPHTHTHLLRDAHTNIHRKMVRRRGGWGVGGGRREKGEKGEKKKHSTSTPGAINCLVHPLPRHSLLIYAMIYINRATRTDCIVW